MVLNKTYFDISVHLCHTKFHFLTKNKKNIFQKHSKLHKFYTHGGAGSYQVESVLFMYKFYLFIHSFIRSFIHLIRSYFIRK